MACKSLKISFSEKHRCGRSRRLNKWRRTMQFLELVWHRQNRKQRFAGQPGRRHCRFRQCQAATGKPSGCQNAPEHRERRNRRQCRSAEGGRENIHLGLDSRIGQLEHRLKPSSVGRAEQISDQTRSSGVMPPNTRTTAGRMLNQPAVIRQAARLRDRRGNSFLASTAAPARTGGYSRSATLVPSWL